MSSTDYRLPTTDYAFFVAGGTLERDAPCYVERQADRALYEGLAQGEFCYVLTSRQMGKSSLMVRTAARLREEGVTVALLDLTALGRNLSVEQWYGGLLDYLGREVGLEDELEAFWLGHGHLGPLQRWMTALERIVLPRFADERRTQLVIFIDEIDAVRSLTFPTDEFFAAVRECYNRRTEDPAFNRLTFCLVGVATPTDLIRDTRVTPFNIGRRIELTDFTASEAAPLALGLAGDGTKDSTPASLEAQRTAEVRREGTEEARNLLHRVLDWTGGHPYLTQRLCRAISEARHAPPADFSQVPPLRPSASSLRPLAKRALKSVPSQRVDRLCDELFLSPQAREQDPNLLFVRDRLLRGDGNLSDLLDLYARVRAGKRIPADDTNRQVDLLLLSGIVTSQPTERSLQVRNRIYASVFDRTWVRAHMPDAELRRQRAAYRRGLLRAGVAASIVLATMAGLTLTALRNARENRNLLARLNKYIGQRALDEGDPLASLPWLAEACRLDQGDRAREEMDRYRLAAVMRRAPRLVHIWAPGTRTVIPMGWSPDLLRVAVQAGDDTVQVWDSATDSPLGAPIRAGGRPWMARFSQSGRHLFMPCSNGVARVWDASTGLATTPPARTEQAHSAAYVSDAPENKRNSWCLTALGVGAATVWNVWTGKPVSPPLRLHATIHAIAFSPDGRRVAMGGEDSTARVWDTRTGRPWTPPMRHSHWVTSVAFSPDGRQVALAGRYGTSARIWDASTGAPVTPFLTHSRGVLYAAFSDDGGKLVTTSLDGSARVWNAHTGQPITPSLRHAAAVGMATFTHDGRWVATASEEGAVRVWDAATGNPLSPPLPHSGRLVGLSFRDEGRYLATVDAGNTLRVWDMSSTEVAVSRFRHRDRLSLVAFSPDGRRILSSGWFDDTTQVQSVTTMAACAPPIRTDVGISHAEFSRDGHRILNVAANNTARVWDAISSRAIGSSIGPAGSAGWAAFSPDGRRVVTAGQGNTARVWDVETGRAITPPLTTEESGIHGCRFSPDGEWVATDSEDGARIWSATHGRLQTHIKEHTSLVFSSDGRRALTWGDASTRRQFTSQVWAIRRSGASRGSETTLALRQLGPVLKHAAPVLVTAFSPDGGRVVTACAGSALIWDAVTGERRAPPMQHSPTGPIDVAFSPDGRRLLTWGGAPGDPRGRADLAIRLWDASTGEPLTPPLLHRSSVDTASFSPDGRRVVTGTLDGTIQVWDVSSDDRPLGDLMLRVEALANRRIDRTGSSVPLMPDELVQVWQTMRARYPSDYVASSEETLSWYQWQANASEETGHWTSADLFLTRLIRAHRDDPSLWSRRGSVRAAMRHWGLAAADLGRATALGITDAGVWRDLALARLAQRDAFGYRRTCEELLRRFRNYPDLYTQHQVAMACAMAPAATPEPLIPLQLARTVVNRYGDGACSFSTTLGASLYRSGRLEEAVHRLKAAIAVGSEGGLLARPSLWLALCHHRLGQREEAGRRLRDGIHWIEHAERMGMPRGAVSNAPLTWRDRLELHILCREAEAAILRPASSGEDFDRIRIDHNPAFRLHR